MMRARVIAGFGLSSEYVEYTIDREGPPPNTIHCSHAVVACVHGVDCACPGSGINARAAADAKRWNFRMRNDFGEEMISRRFSRGLRVAHNKIRHRGPGC